ncbi:hypothetical protein [uncultured Rubinisphaera sp.]|uniref:hypothetical protein n=1 Tax=uncultured Rubinisphaera sp. TaxID=1678686 RepID=UPI000ED07162|nr:hypothetical protein [Planctomycetaceae bacterium]|tara:strand:- start:2348 stop:2581 length:234 start_codon:yes stop_codon:yes gene_type:complete
MAFENTLGKAVDITAAVVRNKVFPLHADCQVRQAVGDDLVADTAICVVVAHRLPFNLIFKSESRGISGTTNMFYEPE